MKEPDNRMVRCVLDGYLECAAKISAACICYQMQQMPDPKYRNLYEREYQRKYGELDD